MRKPFLAFADGGREWWQMRMDDDIVIEVLFGEGRQSVRRLRQRFGDEPPGRCPPHFYRLCKAGVIRTVRLGRAVRVPVSEIHRIAGIL